MPEDDESLEEVIEDALKRTEPSGSRAPASAARKAPPISKANNLQFVPESLAAPSVRQSSRQTHAEGRASFLREADAAARPDGFPQHHEK